MDHARVAAFALEPGANLHQASRVSRSNEIRLRVGDVGELRLEHRRRRARLQEIVNAGGATALLGIDQWYQGEPRNRRENLEWRCVDALRVHKMARCVIR